MNYLPLNLRKSYPENRVSLSKTLTNGVTGYARLIYLPQGIFFGDDLEITHNGNPLIEDTDYILTGYSKHLKHVYNLDGYGLIAITKPTITGSLDINVTYLGDGYTVFDPKDIPVSVPLIGEGIEQILWDNVVIGPNIDTRALSGIYPPSKQIGIEGVISLLNLLADQAIADGPVADRQTVRNIIAQNTATLLEKIPSGLDTNNQTVVGAINELRVLTDSVQTPTGLVSVVYNDLDLTGYTNIHRVGWSIGKNDTTITGAFDDGDSTKLLNFGECLVYDPDTGTLFTDQKPIDIVSTPLFDKTRPAGTCAQPIDGTPVEHWNDAVFKLLIEWFSYGGTLSSVRNNTVVPNNTNPDTYVFYAVGEDGLEVTYPTNAETGPTTITQSFELGDILFLPYGYPTRILKGYHIQWTPEYEDGGSLFVRATNTKANAENIKTRRLGEVFESLATIDHARYLPLNGQAVSRATYADLFKLIGTDYGNGDGATTFNVPNRTSLSSPSQFETTLKRCNVAGAQYNLTLTDTPLYGLLWGTTGTIKRVTLTDGTLVDTGITGIPVFIPAWNETLIYNQANQLVSLNVSALTTTLKGSYGGQIVKGLHAFNNRLFAFGSHILEFNQNGTRNVLATYDVVTKVAGAFVDTNGTNLYYIDGNVGKVLNTLTGVINNYPSLNTVGQGYLGDKGNNTPVLYDAGTGAVSLIDWEDISLSAWGKFIPNLTTFTISANKPDTVWGWKNHHLFNRYQLPTPNQYIVAKKETA